MILIFIGPPEGKNESGGRGEMTLPKIKCEKTCSMSTVLLASLFWLDALHRAISWGIMRDGFSDSSSIGATDKRRVSSGSS
jgi:hypothetical protein